MIRAFLKSKKLSDVESLVVELYYQGFDEIQIAKRLNYKKASVVACLGKSRRKLGYDNMRRVCYEIRKAISGV